VLLGSWLRMLEKDHSNKPASLPEYIWLSVRRNAHRTEPRQKNQTLYHCGDILQYLTAQQPIYLRFKCLRVILDTLF